MVSIKIPTNIKGHLDSDEIDLSSFSQEVDLKTENNSSLDIEDYYSGKLLIKNIKAQYEPFEIGSYKPENLDCKSNEFIDTFHASNNCLKKLEDYKFEY